MPATAAAYQITDSGNPVEDIEYETSGDVTYEMLGSGLECAIHQRITADGATTAVTQIEVTPGSCEGFGFVYEGCEVTGVTATSMPREATVDEEGLEYTSELDFEFSGAGCLLGSEAQTVIKTIEHPINKFSETDPNGFGWEYVTTSNCLTIFGELEETASGTLEVLGGDAGTYEIG